jgi:purine-nucleoside phosphorylase
VVADWLGTLRPAIAIVLGSGLGSIGQQLRSARRLSYRDIPGFPASEVAGHGGELLAGTLADIPVLCQSGRFHAYEGHGSDTVALPVRLFAGLGIRTLLLTNAAGGIAERLGPGSLMLITDQINFTFANPLHGPVAPGEVRFPDMSALFDAELNQTALSTAARLGLRLEQGVYAGLMGPNYETPAEIRMLRTLGADAVGMSTVQEVIAARASGMRCLGISVVTNRAAGLSSGRLSHEEVLAASSSAANALERLVTGIVAQAGRSGAASMAGTL